LTDQKGCVEALLFTSKEPLKLSQLTRALNLSKQTVEKIIVQLNEEYITAGRCFRIELVAGGYRMLTLPEYHSIVNKANIREKAVRLSQAALETLAVIAYKQSVIRAEIERIRGVDCGGVLKNLMTKNLVVIDGKSPAPGNPLLYKTSEYFLEFFGLPSLDHLPPLTEIEKHIDSLPMLKLIKSGENDDDNNADITDKSIDMSDNLATENELPDKAVDEDLKVSLSSEERP